MLESLAINTDLDGGLLDYFAYDFFGTEIEELNLMVVGEIREPSVVGKNHILYKKIWVFLILNKKIQRIQQIRQERKNIPKSKIYMWFKFAVN